MALDPTVVELKSKLVQQEFQARVPQPKIPLGFFYKAAGARQKESPE